MKSASVSCASHVVLLTAALVGSVAVRAQVSPRLHELTIEHRARDGQILYEYRGVKGSIKAGESATIRARDKDKVDIAIKDPNTLLFSYKAGELKEVDVPDLATFSKMAELLTGIFDLSADTALRGKALFNLGTPPPGRMPAAEPTGTLVVGGVTVKTSTLQPTVKDFAKFSAGVPQAYKISTQRAVTEADFDDPSAEATTKEMARLMEFFSALDKARKDPSATAIRFIPDAGGQPEIPYTPDNFLVAFPSWSVVYHLSFAIGAHVERLQAFIAELRRYRAALQTPYPIATVTAKNTKDITQPVLIDPVAGLGGIAGIADYQKAHVGTFNFVISPEQAFHYRVATGVIYSFVRNPEFSVAGDAGSTLTIAEKSADYNEFAGALAFNIYPDRLFYQGVQWYGQIGGAPVKDAAALLLGAGFDAYEKLTLAAGIIYQQRRELGNGQTVGQTLAKAEDLVVRHKFATGLYVMVGLAF